MAALKLKPDDHLPRRVEGDKLSTEFPSVAALKPLSLQGDWLDGPPDFPRSSPPWPH